MFAEIATVVHAILVILQQCHLVMSVPYTVIGEIYCNNKPTCNGRTVYGNFYMTRLNWTGETKTLAEGKFSFENNIPPEHLTKDFAVGMTFATDSCRNKDQKLNFYRKGPHTQLKLDRLDFYSTTSEYKVTGQMKCCFMTLPNVQVSIKMKHPSSKYIAWSDTVSTDQSGRFYAGFNFGEKFRGIPFDFEIHTSSCRNTTFYKTVLLEPVTDLGTMNQGESVNAVVGLMSRSGRIMC